VGRHNTLAGIQLNLSLSPQLPWPLTQWALLLDPIMRTD
jgi:hypothetical protein